MTISPDHTFSGNSIFENVYIYGQLYTQTELISEFGSVIVDGNLKVSGISTFEDDVIIGDVESDGTPPNLQVLGITTLVGDVTIGYGGTNPTLTGITTRGIIGIGTTAPEHTLDVYGDLHITRYF